MPNQIALLRGINVGGRNKVAMSDLRALFGDLGLSNATTLLQSGNVVFQSDRLSGLLLERFLEDETAKRLKISIDYLVRSAQQWKKIVARNPFPLQANDAPNHLVVVFLKTAPRTTDVDALRAAIKGPETIHGDGNQLYVVYPSGIGPSKLTGTSIEANLGSRGTARNWNTVLKLLALCE